MKRGKIETFVRRARWKLRQLELLKMTNAGRAFLKRYKEVRQCWRAGTYFIHSTLVCATLVAHSLDAFACLCCMCSQFKVRLSLHLVSLVVATKCWPVYDALWCCLCCAVLVCSVGVLCTPVKACTTKKVRLC